jgi:fibronectin type 3 domain-containing protein/regulation of enolase protein 1 (concanavalin A-like superfamily)
MCVLFSKCFKYISFLAESVSNYNMEHIMLHIKNAGVIFSVILNLIILTPIILMSQMKKTVLFHSILLFIILSSVCSTITAKTFVHPGGLHTLADLDRMKAKVAAKEHPWIDGWNLMIADPLAQKTYKAVPYTNIGGAGNRQQASKDAHAAYLNTLRWYITGDTTYAECAVNICNAWANTVNVVASGELFQLPVNNFVQAAELLRCYPGWKSADFTKFKTMALTYFYPGCHSFLGNCAYTASWDGPAASSILTIGVLCDDSVKYKEGITYFKSGIGNGSIMKAICQPSGQVAEMGRDQPHASIGPAVLAEMSQTAWNQGDTTLYTYSNNRLLAGLEYYCKFNLNHPTAWVPYNDCDNDNWYYLALNGPFRTYCSPVYEMIYNHYAVLKGKSAPYTQAMANLNRPEAGDPDFFGYGTLTYTLDATASPYPPYPSPAAPTNLAATPGVSRVYLSWTAPDGDVAKGYTVYRSTNGVSYYSIATWSNNTATSYTDFTAVNGTTYYYSVTANNQSGISPKSTAASAMPVAAANLPIGWARKDIGTVAAVGSATYANVGNNTFIISAAGTDVGGTADSHGFVYSNATGNLTITARLTDVSFVGASDKVGIVMRESLNPNSTRVTINLGEYGGRLARFGSRSITGDQTIWADGNKFTWTPVWLRLQRNGSTFTASQSSDGVTWFTIGTSTFTMSNNYYVGLSVCAGSTSGTLNTSVFDHVTTVGGGTAPIAPKTFTATSVNSSRISLSWSSSSATTGYDLRRSTSSAGPYTLVASSITGTTYADSNLEPNTMYYYSLKSANIMGESADSIQTNTQTSALSLPPAPTGLTAVTGNSKVVLNWTATDQSPSSYNVMRSTTLSGTYTLIASPKTNSYTDNTAVNGSTYFYKISAVNIVGEGAASSTINVILPVKLVGTLIGTSGSFGNSSTTTKSAAVDGSLSTYFDANIASGAWVGYDLGTGVTAKVSRINYAPRQSYPIRMVGGVFQGANVSDFSDAITLFTVAVQPTDNVLNEQTVSNTGLYRYLRYLSPSNGSCNVAEIEFWGQKQTSTGISDINETDLLKVYPNPALDQLKIDFTDINKTAEMQLINSRGQIVYSDKSTNVENVIDIHNLPVGIYALRISFKDQLFVKKIIKI